MKRNAYFDEDPAAVATRAKLTCTAERREEYRTVMSKRMEEAILPCLVRTKAFLLELLASEDDVLVGKDEWVLPGPQARKEEDAGQLAQPNVRAILEDMFFKAVRGIVEPHGFECRDYKACNAYPGCEFEITLRVCTKSVMPAAGTPAYDFLEKRNLIRAMEHTRKIIAEQAEAHAKKTLEDKEEILKAAVKEIGLPYYNGRFVLKLREARTDAVTQSVEELKATGYSVVQNERDLTVTDEQMYAITTRAQQQIEDHAALDNPMLKETVLEAVTEALQWVMTDKPKVMKEGAEKPQEE